MSDFKVEKGIPVPPRQARYPFREMKVGESFFVPCTDEEKARIQNRLTNSCAKARGFGTFTVRRVEGGVRAWKIEEADDAEG